MCLWLSHSLLSPYPHSIVLLYIGSTSCWFRYINMCSKHVVNRTYNLCVKGKHGTWFYDREILKVPATVIMQSDFIIGYTFHYYLWTLKKVLLFDVDAWNVYNFRFRMTRSKPFDGDAWHLFK